MLRTLYRVRRMQGARVEPNLITYNALIHACAQVGALPPSPSSSSSHIASDLHPPHDH